ncbi:MAG TPA: ferritin-like domain-containing protein [Thermoleophilaceae bacterium]
MSTVAESPQTEPPPRGALDELASDPSSRKRFLRAIGGGAAAATLSLALAACGRSKDKGSGNQFGGAGVGTAQYGQGDAGIANFALALEYLEADFYAAAIDSGHLSGRALHLFQRFGAEERAHVTTLEGTVRSLGGTPAPRRKTIFPLENQNQILRVANQIEALGAAAYLGQVDRIESRQVLAAALSIHTVEARHAAVLSTMLGQPISPDGAFARPSTSTEVSQQAQPFITG